MRRKGIARKLVRLIIVMLFVIWVCMCKEHCTKDWRLSSDCWLNEKVERCERICVEDFEATELYIRVLEDNDAAMQMYHTLGYEVIGNPDDPPKVRLLRKYLSATMDNSETT